MFTDPSGLSPVTAEACADIKDRISNLNGGAPKIEERIRRIWQSVYDTWCGSLMAPTESQLACEYSRPRGRFYGRRRRRGRARSLGSRGQWPKLRPLAPRVHWYLGRRI
jgi:hypothetical protein